jgi:hypothetical protein
MANEFKHLSVGGEISQAEYEAVGGHVLESQATGDLIYAISTSQLSRLGIGSTGAVLTVTGGVPVWDTTWTPTGHLIPAADDSYDLGSASAAWQDLFLEGDITLTDAGTLATSAGALTITSAAAATWSTSAGALTLNGTGGVNLQEGGSTIIGISDSRALSTTNTASVDLDASGAIQINSSGGALSIGNDNVDQTINIATAGTRTLNIGIGDGTDITTTVVKGTLSVGVDDAGYDVVFYGDTASANMTWDTSVDDLILNGAARIVVPDGQLVLGSTAVGSTAAELNVLDGVTAGTVAASKGVVVDSNKDIGSFRNLTATGELDAATLDLSSSADIAGDLVLSGGADGALQFTNAGENSIKIPDNQASALIIEEADNAYLIFDTANSSESVSIGTGISGTEIILGHSTSEVTVADNLTVTGNLTVNGTTTTVDTATLAVEDPLIALATGNGADSVDVGFYAKYTDSGVKYSGLFRDASDSDKWKLFATTGNSHEVPTTTVNTTSGFTLGTLVASAFEGDITGDVTGNVSGTAATVTGATQSAITAVGTLGSVDIDGGAIDGVTLGTNSAVTQAVIDNININGTTIGHTSDTDLLTLTSGNLAVAGDVALAATKKLILDGGGEETYIYEESGDDLHIVVGNVAMIQIDQDIATTGSMAFGAGATPTADQAFVFNHDFGEVTVNNTNLGVVLTPRGVETGGTHGGGLIGMRIIPYLGAANTQAWNAEIGVKAIEARILDGTSTSNSYTVTGAAGLHIKQAQNKGSITLTNQYGVYFDGLTAATNDFYFGFAANDTTANTGNEYGRIPIAVNGTTLKYLRVYDD